MIDVLQTTPVKYIFFVESVGISIQIYVICFEVHNPEENIIILAWYLFLVESFCEKESVVCNKSS